jgi:antitoxin (DNA-binding transcriptional repressor) of toxin-antitoxin stability system
LEAKNRLSQLIKAARAGEEVVIANDRLAQAAHGLARNVLK